MYEVGCVSPILSNCGDVGAIFHLIALHGAPRGFLAIGDKQQISDYGADCNKDSHVFEAFVQGLLVGSLNGIGFFIDGGKVVCLSLVKHVWDCVPHFLHLGNRFIQIVIGCLEVFVGAYEL